MKIPKNTCFYLKFDKMMNYRYYFPYNNLNFFIEKSKVKPKSIRRVKASVFKLTQVHQLLLKKIIEKT